jgi:carboxymethylenebutenolidase
VGFGAGGTLALLFGCASTRVAAAVPLLRAVVYPELSAAKPIQPLELGLNLGAPLLACFGERDPSTPPEDVARLRTALSQFSKDFDIVTYPGAAHGFMREGRRRLRCRGGRDAWRRALAFLEQRLA